MHKRVVLLGSTGLEKAGIGRKCQSALMASGCSNVRVVDFERDFVEPSPLCRSLAAFLSQPDLDQARTWRDAWTAFVSTIKSDDVTLLLMHGTYVREAYSVRIGVDISRVCDEFQPTLVLSLTDDLYNLWWRTDARANGDPSIGMPTFEQLFLARRAEALLGDMIVRQMAAKGVRARHITLSVQHPTSVITSLVRSERATVAYLSFPISAPRELSAGTGDMKSLGQDTTNGINEFHQKALATHLTTPSVIFISPLAIDELPFASATALALKADQKEFPFSARAARWPVKDLWPETELLASPAADPIPRIRTKEAASIQSAIASEVGWRDYRLVLQADFVACYSPMMPRPDNTWRTARGVRAELDKAAEHQIPCYVFQEPSFDPSGVWAKESMKNQGTMGETSRSVYIQNASSSDEVFATIVKRAKTTVG